MKCPPLSNPMSNAPCCGVDLAIRDYIVYEIKNKSVDCFSTFELFCKCKFEWRLGHSNKSWLYDHCPKVEVVTQRMQNNEELND